MFDRLSNSLQKVFRDLRTGGRLSEESVDVALREVRLALLDADVAMPVARGFLEKVRARAVGAEILGSLAPGEQVVRIIRDELIAVMGGKTVPPLRLKKFPSVIMLCGLQGSGKTTTAAKLALHLKKTRGSTPLLVPADLARPAAILQLLQLAGSLNVAAYDSSEAKDPVQVAADGLAWAKRRGYDPVILDTAGRLHVDDELMGQLTAMRDAVKPDETLFVADSMTGQDAVRSASLFDEAVGISGIILTKLDGDAKGGAALSICEITGKPIRFAGVGEKPRDFDVFHPDRMVSRLLGHGDLQTLMEKVEQEVDKEDADKVADDLGKGNFTLETLLTQMKQMRKLGPLSSVVQHLPRVGPLKGLGALEIDDDALVPVEAMIRSMTPRERRRPELINGSRKKRIAKGSGRTVVELNRLLKQFVGMRKMMKQALSKPARKKKKKRR